MSKDELSKSGRGDEANWRKNVPAIAAAIRAVICDKSAKSEDAAEIAGRCISRLKAVCGGDKLYIPAALGRYYLVKEAVEKAGLPLDWKYFENEMDSIAGSAYLKRKRLKKQLGKGATLYEIKAICETIGYISGGADGSA